MSEAEALANGGLYEVFVGTKDLESATGYWKSFGYRVLEEARLDRSLARDLYQHDSAARVRRLQAEADHGLVRLLEWQEPSGTGLGMRGLRFAGNRWTGQFARSLLKVANHVEAAAKAGEEIEGSEAHFIDMGRAYAHLFGGKAPIPFKDELIALREMQVFRPESRQIVMERFGYESPLLGTYADQSLLRTTQIVQGCMVVRSDDPDIFRFYEEVLGLRRSLDITIPWEDAQASRAVFQLAEGETHWNVDLDEPASGTSLAERRSGRIKAFRFSDRWPTKDVYDFASPGALGYSNYSWRVKDIAEAAARCSAMGATFITSVIEDEFGDMAMSLRAPDGYFWTFLEKRLS
jgi:uncharacterized glyoxalase superfamily protein PhnB